MNNFRFWDGELATVSWLIILTLLVAWWWDIWLVAGWLFAGVVMARWWLALWTAQRWLTSGGRSWHYWIAGPLSYFLLATMRLLEDERRQSQKLLSRARYFKYAAKALPEGVIALDKSYQITWFNQGAVNLLGLTRNDRNRSILSVIRTPEVMGLISGSAYTTAELSSPLSANRILSLELRPFMLGHDLLIVRDITAFKSIDRIRRDFVANASHELRTPLTVMHGYVETMLDTPGLHHQQWLKPLQQMHQQTERMRTIIEDMLTLSRLEADDDRMEKEAVDVSDMLVQIQEEAQQFSGESHHHIFLSLETEVGLWGYENYLRSAFTNLVTNAIRYTPEGGEVRIRWWLDEAGVHFSVCDTGIGIAPEHIPRITERFYRVDSARSRATGGTGLGLAITRHVLDKHDANLTVESELGKGSCFSCHFSAGAVAFIN
jgi:two-component system, OmpR family, phosphate regulon sensor histidine kinase PhoR